MAKKNGGGDHHPTLMTGYRPGSDDISSASPDSPFLWSFLKIAASQGVSSKLLSAAFYSLAQMIVALATYNFGPWHTDHRTIGINMPLAGSKTV
jgi:hypothetical protein